MTHIVSKIKGYKALLYLGDKIVLGKLNRIYLANMELTKLDYICTVGTTTPLMKLSSYVRLIQRLFRFELGPAVSLNNQDCFIVFFRNQVFHVNTTLRVATKEHFPELKHRPLSLTKSKIASSCGFIYCGEYTPNIDYKPVNIYKRDLVGAWNVVYQFPDGQVNHIHGIFEDLDKACFYILTGDFNQGAGIWLANPSFTDVKPLVRSGQDSRACWILPWKNKLVFATDRQDSNNSLCEIENLKDVVVNKLFPIVGSSIFFSNTHTNKIIFSTAIEPRSINKFSIISLISIRNAKGMLGNKSCVYFGTLESGFEIIFSDEKDWFPFKLFQFGNITFPSSETMDETFLHFSCVALKNSDDTTFAVKIDNSILVPTCVG